MKCDLPIAVITGGERGLGFEIAKILSCKGYKVVIWGIDQSHLDHAQQEISNCTAECVDVTNESHVLSAFERLKACPSVLINNAGIVGSPDQGAVIWSDRLNSARIRETFEVNCLAHYWTIKCVLPKMIERAKLDSQFHGSIVSITSVMGNLAGAGMSQYAASKAAANSIIRTLKFELWKEELSDRIHTLLVQPFILNTSMFASVSLGLSYLFQRQDAKSTAEEIVSAMLKKKSEITVPWFFRFFLAFILLIPDQILYWLLILARADTGMSTFENSK